MARQWERVDENPPPSFSVPTHEYTHRQGKRDLRMWTGGRYDCDDVMRALVRLDRPEIRPGTSGQNDKTIPTYFTDPEVDAPTVVPGSESCTPPSFNGPHWNEAFDAMLEDADFCEDGETTIARDGAVATPGGFCITDDSQEEIEEDEVPQILLQARRAFRHPGYRVAREDPNTTHKSRGFSGPRRGTSDRDRGPCMKRSSLQQLKLRTRCARCRKLGHWAHECPEGNRGQRNDERYDRRAVRLGENPKAFITVAKLTERRPFFLGASWTFVSLDPGEVLWDTGAQEGLFGKQQLEKWCKLLAEHGLQVEWSQEKTRICKWNRRRDATSRCCVCASWFDWMQRYHKFIIPGGYSAEFYGWTAKTDNIGTTIRQVPYTFFIPMLEDKDSKNQVTNCYDFPSEAVLWIKEVEMVMTQHWITPIYSLLLYMTIIFRKTIQDGTKSSINVIDSI